MSRRDDVLDAAISLLGQGGVRAVTHRAVDARAGLPAGATSNLFRTRDALLGAVVERFAEREKANWDELAAHGTPATPAELTAFLAAVARDAVGPHRTLTLARYVILVEAAHQPALRAPLLAAGRRADTWFTTWLRLCGSADPGRDAAILANAYSGLVLHELANPDPDFDPGRRLGPIVAALMGGTDGP
ncbi:TetR family transcriptional regulator [Asanoa sp. WMMD1127]|uniref:TetR/AcrR family transcriptional regulator n=1 Tax=Asanoa sp. WMMD1127 TaxID=3016107 RepID=UPI00241684BB|nr:TetR/AcrR family transcriptional regulator [Asanoa sp. WMMD1127]MDG4825537.1 TetR family transcriptional regulator [Asanoa sp. WMMD1127]